MSQFKRTPVALIILGYTYPRFIAFAFLILLSMDGAFAQLATKRLPKDDLMLFRNEDNQIDSIKTLVDWQRRRQSIVDGMTSIMGQLPGDSKRCPLDMRIEEEIDGGSYVRRLITYESEPGCRVPAYLLVPKTVLNSGGKVSAILCLHGTNNVIGHGTVVGLGDTPNRAYAKELAEQGFVTLAPNYPLLAKYQPDLSQLGWSSGTLKAVWDNQRGLDLLESLPYVDNTQGFGCIGHSLGGHNGLFTSVFDSRIRAVVTSCGFDSFSDYYGGKESVWMPDKGWCQSRYMPKLLDYRGRLKEIPFDFPEVLGAIAPRKVMVVAPLYDSNFVAASVDRAIASARSVYQLYGQPNHLMLEHPECPHDFPTEMRELAYALFKKELKFASSANSKTATAPDLIVHHAQLLTVDDAFSIREAMAIRGEKIVAVGSNDEILKLAGVETKLLDCQGKTVLPGLIDSHVHATGASTYEFDHPVPTMETIEDVLKYIGSRAEVLDDGEWIIVQQVFVTRLRDQRFPTRDELDRVAPNNPIVFRTGPDAALNSLALNLSQIDRNFVMPEGKTGKVEFDPQTGEPTGIIRSSGELIKPKSPIRKPSQEEEILQLKKLLADYNSVGITSVSDRNASNDGLQLYQKLRERNDLTCRVYLYYGVNASESLKQIEEKIKSSRVASFAPGESRAMAARCKSLLGWWHAYRQCLHERTMGSKPNLWDQRPQLSRNSLYRS
jgi:Amidohydrolase family